MNKKRIQINYIPMLLSSVLTVLISFNAYSQNSKAPNFAVYSIDGKRKIFYKILKTLPNNGILILNFTSIYCRPCKKEIPELLSIIEKAKERTILMCIYSEMGEPVKKSASQLGNLQEAYTDPFKAIKKKFNVKKIPVTILIKKNQNILKRFEGYTEKSINEIKKIISIR